MSLHPSIFSSSSEEWSTPVALFEQLDSEFGPFTLDACATPTNAKCGRFFTKVEDGLVQPWAPHRVFVNPPYGRQVGRWLEKAVCESERGALVVCLLPVRTDTAWFHEIVEPHATEIRFLRGRLTFGDAPHPAPFPSAIVVFAPRRHGPAISITSDRSRARRRMTHATSRV